jgi:hypothetical protein
LAFFLPVFQKFRSEGESIGRLLVGYDVLEIALCRCVAEVVNNLDIVVRKMFGARGQLKRIRTAVSIGRASYESLGLVDLFDEVICEMRHCLDIRNQFAHSEFYEDPDNLGSLLFANIEDLVSQQGVIDELISVPAKRITRELLEEQEIFCTYVYERLFFVKCEARVKVGTLSQNPYSIPIITAPKLHLPRLPCDFP